MGALQSGDSTAMLARVCKQTDNKSTLTGAAPRQHRSRKTKNQRGNAALA
jgi:hypothetical protein